MPLASFHMITGNISLQGAIMAIIWKPGLTNVCIPRSDRTQSQHNLRRTLNIGVRSHTHGKRTMDTVLRDGVILTNLLSLCILTFA